MIRQTPHSRAAGALALVVAACLGASVPAAAAPAPTKAVATKPPAKKAVAKKAPAKKTAARPVLRPSGLPFDSGTYNMNRAATVTRLAAARGRRADVVSVFPSRESWENLQSTWYMDRERIPANFTGTLNVGMPLFPRDGNLAAAAAGRDNAQWREFARNLAKRYPTAYVRVGWEMNLPDWYYAATPANAAAWKRAYRQAVLSMKSVAPRLRFVWCVNEGPGNDAARYYPGNDVVNIVGMDAYDWDPGYTTAAKIAYHRDSPFGWNHWLAFAKAHRKLFALPEWGIAPANPNSGGDNPLYIRFVYSWLKANAPAIAFESYFQENDGYIRSDLLAGRSPKASNEYRRWMTLLARR